MAKIHFLADGGTEEDIRTHNFANYLDEYKDASPAVFKAIETGVEQYAEYTDSFGNFRSIFLPLKTQRAQLRRGRRYLAKRAGCGHCQSVKA